MLFLFDTPRFRWCRINVTGSILSPRVKRVVIVNHKTGLCNWNFPSDFCWSIWSDNSSCSCRSDIRMKNLFPWSLLLQIIFENVKLLYVLYSKEGWRFSSHKTKKNCFIACNITILFSHGFLLANLD